MVLFSCGCGAKTQIREEAINHVVQKGHAMTVSGMIYPEEVGAERKTPRRLGGKPWLSGTGSTRGSDE